MLAEVRRRSLAGDPDGAMSLARSMREAARAKGDVVAEYLCVQVQLVVAVTWRSLEVDALSDELERLPAPFPKGIPAEVVKVPSAQVDADCAVAYALAGYLEWALEPLERAILANPTETRLLDLRVRLNHELARRRGEREL